MSAYFVIRAGNYGQFFSCDFSKHIWNQMLQSCHTQKEVADSVFTVFLGNTNSFLSQKHEQVTNWMQPKK